MPKPNKSSASSGTRKKHAKKAAGGPNDGDEPGPSSQGQGQGKNKPQRGEKKLSKAQKRAQPKVKQYFAPPKPPAPPIPDPLDSQGLARTLPAELVIFLRRLGKKDDVTRRKGVDDLREWVERVRKLSRGREAAEGAEEAEAGAEAEAEVQREIEEETLVSAVPVWLHNLASLLSSPSHRSASLQLHSELLSIPSVKSAIIDSLSLGLLPGTQNRDVLGSWLVASLDETRRNGMNCWNECTSWKARDGDHNGPTSIELSEQLSSLVEFCSLAVLDPVSLHDDIHPAPVASSTPAPAPAPKKGPKSPRPPPPPQTSPEEEALKEERSARYRIGGFAALSYLVPQMMKAEVEPPTDLLELIRRPTLWSALSSAKDGDSTSIGFEQPAVRRAAYNLLEVLIDAVPQEVARPATIGTLSEAVLGSCWSESDAGVWQFAGPTVVRFLARHRESWSIAAAVSGGSDKGEDEKEDEEGERDEGEGEGSGNDNDNDNDNDEDTGHHTASEPALSKPFADFLSFISTICPTIPSLTYPLLTLIISTIPDSILPLSSPTRNPSFQLESLLTHLWSPLDARLLSTHSLPNQPSVFQTFFAETIDCLVYLVGKAWKQSADESLKSLVNEHLAGRAWSEGILSLGGRGRGSKEIEAEAFGAALRKIVKLDPRLTGDALKLIRESLLEQALEEGGASRAAMSLIPRTIPLIAALKSGTEDEVSLREYDGILKAVSEKAVMILDMAVEEKSPAVAVLAELVAQALQEGSAVGRSALRSSLANKSPTYAAALSPALYVALHDVVSDDAVRKSFWAVLDDASIDQATRFALAESLLSSPNSELSTDSCLDSIALEATQAALHDSSGTSLASIAIRQPTALSVDARNSILALICTAIHSQVDDLLNGSDGPVPIDALKIFAAHAERVGGEVIKSDIQLDALVAVHHLTHLLPRESLETFIVPAVATAIWSGVSALREDEKTAMQEAVDGALADMLGQTSCRIQPAVLVDVALSSQSASAILSTLLPSTERITDMLGSLTSTPSPASLSVTDAMIPCTASLVESSDDEGVYDAQGRSKTARYIEALLCVLRSDRKLSLSYPEVLSIVAQSATLTQDALDLPGGSRGLWSSSTARSTLKESVREAEGTISIAVASADEGDLAWHKSAVDLLKSASTENKAQKGDWLVRLLLSLKQDSTDVSARAFREVLSKYLRQSGAGEKEAEVWLNYGITLAERASDVAIAIVLAVKPILLDTELFTRTQNRFASALTTVPPSKASDQGIPTIRLLIASAPPPDAPSVFLPQQRALLVLRHIGSWLASDEADEFDESMEVYIAQVYASLAPVVQDLSGAHWDGIFDLIENGLEGSSMADPTTHSLLHECLVLLQQVRDLCETNKSLRAMWEVVKDKHLQLVLGLFLQCRDAQARAAPVRRIQDLILDLLQDVPEKEIKAADLGKLCDLLRLSTSPTIQTTAYRILSIVVKARTVALVLDVEASVAEAEEGHSSEEIKLPTELTDIALTAQGVDWHAEDQVTIHHVLSQLLTWMTILDHFEDASRTLRWAYLDHISSLSLLSEGLIPLLFSILGITEVGAWNFPATSYEVDEFYTDLLLPESLPDLTPLASHVFYRTLVTLPSLIRSYFESLKDRQLSMSMLAFTARHYSPVIIKHEFSALRRPEAISMLSDEGLNVRIVHGGGASAAGATGSAEAVASYVVDEQPMEIGIRLPAEFPLKGVDVRDLKRVGVPENKWRGWLMGLQQTITSRNGLILEALSVFKRNVALHFEGVVECAICYSIISLTDRTLPTKPCRTCKNRFHASCLFKWFNSSHSSSCPMCRALF